MQSYPFKIRVDPVKMQTTHHQYNTRPEVLTITAKTVTHAKTKKTFTAFECEHMEELIQEIQRGNTERAGSIVHWPEPTDIPLEALCLFDYVILSSIPDHLCDNGGMFRPWKHDDLPATFKGKRHGTTFFAGFEKRTFHPDIQPMKRLRPKRRPSPVLPLIDLSPYKPTMRTIPEVERSNFGHDEKPKYARGGLSWWETGDLWLVNQKEIKCSTPLPDLKTLGFLLRGVGEAKLTYSSESEEEEDSDSEVPNSPESYGFDEPLSPALVRPFSPVFSTPSPCPSEGFPATVDYEPFTDDPLTWDHMYDASYYDRLHTSI